MLGVSEIKTHLNRIAKFWKHGKWDKECLFFSNIDYFIEKCEWKFAEVLSILNYYIRV